ncbi:MAG: hypothetical protein M9939_19245 [Mesorhizobium sp.]|nr:hypothetical protein [Mesorhizobium sp.]MCO5163274.1 hypothetical protein [Mesorhizobium sp.]
MRSKLGSTVLIALLYGQAALGLVAVGATLMKEHSGDRALVAPTVEIASAATTAVR